MPFLDIFLDFLAGMLLCNCIPHLAAGLRGEAFPTPFAKPPGKGLSKALTNFLWGAGNLLAGVILIHRTPIVLGLNSYFIALAAGFVLLGIWTSRHFATVRQATKH